MPIVREGGPSRLIESSNTLMVQCVTGQELLTAVLQFVMRWNPDQSVARTWNVRMSAPVTTALMLTVPQVSTVSILTLAHDHAHSH